MSGSLVLLIDGRSGSGKTTLAAHLAKALEELGLAPARFALEDIYPGWEGLEAAVRLCARDIAPLLASGQSASWRPWDWSADAPSPETRRTEASRTVLLEGVGASSAPVVSAILDAGGFPLPVWIEADDDDRRTRALSRDGETYAPFWAVWAAQEEAWLSSPEGPVPPMVRVPNNTAGASPRDLTWEVLEVCAALCPDSPLRAVLRQDWAVSERGRCPAADSAALAALFRDFSAGLPHSAWLDSSMNQASERNRTILFAAGDLGLEHAQGSLRTSGPLLAEGRRETEFFPWISEAWPSETGNRHSQSGHSDIAWIAQLGYELRRECGTPETPAPEASDADARLFWPSRLLALDVATGEWALSERGLRPRRRSGETLSSGVVVSRNGAEGPEVRLEFRDSREEYLGKIAAAMEEIRVGNSYEVCLTTRLTAPAPEDPMALFLALREVSPAPFGSFVRFAAGSEREWSLVSSSPERFLKVSDGVVTAEPIKGTRPRGATAVEDAALRAELEGSAKDRAENIMIVDLLRNDLGATAQTGSVRVERLCAIEEYATVFQMVSTISARVREGVPRGELLRAAFPPGSMTGCPKISTMEILGRLEGERRGAYSGSVGYLGWDGSADLNVVIRSAEIRGGVLSVGVGGAITVDSDPAAEWDEVQAKTAGIRRALDRPDRIPCPHPAEPDQLHTLASPRPAEQRRRNPSQ